MSRDDELVLVLIPLPGAHPLRVPLAKRITTIGSDPAADLCLATAPRRWITVHLNPTGEVELHVVATGERRRLAVGDRFAADGLELGVEAAVTGRVRERSIASLVSALAAVDSPERAIELMLAGLIAAAGADLGALILSDDDSYRVAAARDRDGAVLDRARELLSDTIVRDVLGTGERVRVDDVAAHSRYAALPSVAAMGLGSALCLPMQLDGRTLGAVFLARRDRAAHDDRALAELQILAAVAVPMLAQLRRGGATAPGELIGESPAIARVRSLVRRVGPSDLSTLLHGPSGSGKELVCRALHAASTRAARPMIAINCAAVAPSLLDAELFGYKKGAFTGAMTDRVGLVEAAHGSTLFLDEIGDMPLAMQTALLRVLEQREVKRIGDTTPRAVDFRLVAATHRDLDAEVAAGRFRADLLFRLREVTIEVPSLAERGDDIDLLAHAFLRQTETQLGLALHTLADDAVAALRTHPWPGNVRELKATMRRAAVLADSRTIRAADRGFAAAGPAPGGAGLAAGALAARAPGLAAGRPASSGEADSLSGASPSRSGLRALVDAALAPDAPLRPLAALRDDFVRGYVELAIERAGGDREAAARALEIGVRSLYRYLS